jgi:hypothetical protein
VSQCHAFASCCCMLLHNATCMLCCLAGGQQGALSCSFYSATPPRPCWFLLLACLRPPV